jgi:hypothetical protein
MTDFGADNFIRSRYVNLDSIAQAWMAGITGGVVVAVIISVVAYSDYQSVPQLPLTTSATSFYGAQPLLPVMPDTPPGEPKP